MARTSQRWGCGEELAERLRWHADASLRQGADCSLLIFRPLEQTPLADKGCQVSACDPLPALAECLRPYVRRTDAVELDAGNAVAVILYNAGRQGAHATFQRLRDLLATPSRTGDPTFAITIGYATSAASAASATSSAEPDDERSITETIASAWKPRVLLRVALPATSERPAPHTDEAVSRPSNSASGTVEAAQRPIAASARTTRRSHLRLVAFDSLTQPVDEDLRERARVLGVPFVQLPPRLPASCRGAIAPELARELNAVPIGRSRNMLTVAMHDPNDASAVLRLRSATGLAIFPVLAASEELERALRQLARA